MEFLENATLGFCWWDIPALVLLIAVAVLFFVRRHKLNEEKKKLQNK